MSHLPAKAEMKDPYPFGVEDEILPGSNENIDTSAVDGLSTEDLFMNKEELKAYLIAAELAKRTDELFGDLLKDNAELRGFCSHPSAIIEIDTGEAKPVFRRQYSIPFALHEKVEKQIQEWLEEGFIVAHNENTDYNNPLLVVPKYDLAHAIKAWRVCIDPRLLNLCIKSVNYPLPLIEDLLLLLAGATYFSKLDLRKGFHQFRVEPNDRLKTTFCWNGQQYCFVGAPFGFKHVPSVFQKVMMEIF